MGYKKGITEGKIFSLFNPYSTNKLNGESFKIAFVAVFICYFPSTTGISPKVLCLLGILSTICVSITTKYFLISNMAILGSGLIIVTDTLTLVVAFHGFLSPIPWLY